MSYQSNLWLENDIVDIVFYVNDDINYENTLNVSYDNEVLNMSLYEYDGVVSIEEFDHPYIYLSIIRNKQNIYEEDIDMTNQEMITLTGSNKDYSITNVYMTSSWLKTGDFSCKIEHLEETYPYMSIDYMIADEEVELNEYERFAYISGDTLDILDNHEYQCVYNDVDSLFDKNMICAITLMKSEEDNDSYTFIIELKAVDPYE